jgi:SPP1 gp7 family putative phage head morphogenesis protein
MPDFQFDLPPEKALEFFRGKGLKAGFSWQDTWQQEHDQAFTVAKMMQLDLLADVKASLDKALASGETFHTWRDNIEPRLLQAGWWGKAEMVDPASGEKKLVELGSPRRLRTIYRTNMMTAYAAGHWAEIQEAKPGVPYLMYDAVGDERTRDEHLAWDGTVLPVDDPWWNTHTPPNGFNCRCGVIALTADQVKAMGLEVADEAPPVREREYVNPRTGEISVLPEGIDPGFAYNPGASRAADLTDRLASKAAAAEPELGAAAFRALSQPERQAFQATHERWVEQVLATPSTSRQPPARIVGGISLDDLKHLQGRGVELRSAAILMEARLINGAKAQRHAGKARPGGGSYPDNGLTPAEWKALPQAVESPKAVMYDAEQRSLLYVIDAGDRRTKLAVSVDYSVKGAKLNLVKTAFKVTPAALTSDKRYSLVRGSLQ